MPEGWAAGCRPRGSLEHCGTPRRRGGAMGSGRNAHLLVRRTALPAWHATALLNEPRVPCANLANCPPTQGLSPVSGRASSLGHQLKASWHLPRFSLGAIGPYQSCSSTCQSRHRAWEPRMAFATSLDVEGSGTSGMECSEAILPGTSTTAEAVPAGQSANDHDPNHEAPAIMDLNESPGGRASHRPSWHATGGPADVSKPFGPVGQGGSSIDDFYAAYGLIPFRELPGASFTVRVRQHVNPLKASLVGPMDPLDWASVYEDPSLPLLLDVGCASGRLPLVLAQRGQGQQNVLGLEIRRPLVERANLWAQQLGLRNAHFLLANATLFLRDILADYPGPVGTVTVLCPDPQFKKKHKKRRIVQPQFTEAVANLVAPGGMVFVQSDILEVAEDMRMQFLEHAPHLEQDRSTADEDGWSRESPLGVPSEREAVVLSRGGAIYRAIFFHKR